MNLLLFISALLTGLTGAFSGVQHAEAPAMHQSIAQAIEVDVEKAHQYASPERRHVDDTRRPVRAIFGVKPAWELHFQPPAIDIARIYERLLV